MKIALFIFLLMSSFSFAASTCANFAGKYRDEENIQIEIQQVACQTVRFISVDKTTEIILDGKSRQHETGDKQISYVSATINQTELNLEQIIQNKAPVSTGYLYKMILNYKFKDSETLIEDSKLYNQAGKLIDYKTISLFKIRTAN